jgi:Protein of unknown function, DUF481
VPRPALRAATAALVILLAAATPALAARTDIIVLRNGDHITCEIVQMRQGKLQAKTDDAGTLSIEWDKIVSITTADQYEVLMRDGSNFLGRFRPGPPGSLELVAGAGVAPVVMADIASFTRIKAGFFQRIDGSFDLGGSYTKSSGVAELFLDSDATYRRPRYAYTVSFATNVTQQPEVDDTSRYALTASYTRYRGARWFASAATYFEGNRELGFTFRGTGAMSIGRYLAQRSHVEWLLAGGFAAGAEQPVDRSTVTNVDTLIASTLSVFAYDYPSTRLDATLLVFPSLDDPGRVRVNANGKVKRELFKDFYVSLTAYDAFDNRPKAATAAQSDFGVSLSFGWTF